MKKIDVRMKLESDLGKDLVDRVQEINAVIDKVVKERDVVGDKEQEPLKVRHSMALYSI